VLVRGGLDDSAAEWSSFCDRIGWSRGDEPMPADFVARVRQRVALARPESGADPSSASAVAARAGFDSHAEPELLARPAARRSGARGVFVALACAAAVAASWAAGAAGLGRSAIVEQSGAPASLVPAPPAMAPPSSSPPAPSTPAPRAPMDAPSPSSLPAPSSAPSEPAPGIAALMRAAPRPRPRPEARAIARLETPRGSTNPEPRREDGASPPAADASEALATTPPEPLELAALAAGPREASLIGAEPSQAPWQDAPAVSLARAADRGPSWSLSPEARRAFGASLSPSLQPEGLPSVGVMAQLDVGRAIGAL
jgi:hypothetical protein